MGKAILFDGKINHKYDKAFIECLADVAKIELSEGIDNDFLRNIYMKTYGQNIAERVFEKIL